MDYEYKYPDIAVRYYASDMWLHIDSDAVHLVQPRARSRVAGHFYLSSKIQQGTKNT